MLTRLYEGMQAELVAQRCLLRAVIATHPKPSDLLGVYLDQMDTLADQIPAAGIGTYREAAHRLQAEILESVRRHAGRG
jgi:hypothetical protein